MKKYIKERGDWKIEAYFDRTRLGVGANYKTYPNMGWYCTIFYKDEELYTTMVPTTSRDMAVWNATQAVCGRIMSIWSI